MATRGPYQPTPTPSMESKVEKEREKRTVKGGKGEKM